MASFHQEKREMVETLTRNNIFDSAISIINEGGWDALTMEHIARNAGMSKGNIYYYFKSKEDVLGFVASRIFEPVAEQFAKLDDNDTDPSATFASMLDVMAEHSIKNPFSTQTRSDPETEREIVRIFENQQALAIIKARMANVVRRGIESGVFDPELIPAYAIEYAMLVLVGLACKVSHHAMSLPIKADFIPFVKTRIMSGMLSR